MASSDLAAGDTPRTVGVDEPSPSFPRARPAWLWWAVLVLGATGAVIAVALATSLFLGLTQSTPGPNAAGAFLSSTPLAMNLAGRWPVLQREWPIVLGAGLVSLGLSVLALALAMQVRSSLARAVKDSLRQANGLPAGQFHPLPEPALAELKPLISALNLTVGRLQRLHQASLMQLEALRQQAQVDALTGLSNRRQFMASLHAALDDQLTTPQIGLLLIRMCDRQGMVRRNGRASVDRLAVAAAHMLQVYVERIPGCTAGRLNDTDLALLLPVADLAMETAQVLTKALRVQLVLIDASANLCIGAAELCGPITVSKAMAMADEALASAEADRPFAVAGSIHRVAGQPIGEFDWRQQILAALADERVTLKELPLFAPDGRLSHVQCVISVRPADGSQPIGAEFWMAQALRSHLCIELDGRALELVLHAIENDGRSRSVRLSVSAVSHSEFLARVGHLLEASRVAARGLWIDLPHTLALDRPELLRELSRRWRPLGVKLALSQVGDGMARIADLSVLGIDGIRIGVHHLSRVSGHQSDAGDQFLTGLMGLAHAASLLVCAEGDVDPADLPRIWRLGVDAARYTPELATASADGSSRLVPAQQGNPGPPGAIRRAA